MTSVPSGRTSCRRFDFCRRAKVLVRSSCDWVKWAHPMGITAVAGQSPPTHRVVSIHHQMSRLSFHVAGTVIADKFPARLGESIVFYLCGLGVTSPSVPSGEPSPPCVGAIQIPGYPAMPEVRGLHRTASEAVENPADTGDTGLLPSS